MDIRSLLNDQVPVVKSSSLPRGPSLQSQQPLPSINASLPSQWHDAEQSRDRCNLRSLLVQNPVPVRNDSMSASPKPENAAHRHQDYYTLPKLLPCYQCSKRFTRRSDLVRHERIHSGVRPHSCAHPGCGKAFIQRSALTIHERVHTGDKPHQCAQCNKPFSDSSSLARHRRTHTGVRPYRCDFPGCGKDFTRKTTLSRHRQQHSTKGHLPVRVDSVAAQSMTSATTVSSYEVNTPRTMTAASSPNLQQPLPGSCYITFQINQPEERYQPHRREHTQYSRDHQQSHSSRHLEAPQRSLPSMSHLSAGMDYHRHEPAHHEGDYFSRHRPSLQHSQSHGSSYSGTPLPRIVAGWGDEKPQYGPISTGYRVERERRDSAVGGSRPCWSPVHRA